MADNGLIPLFTGIPCPIVGHVMGWRWTIGIGNRKERIWKKYKNNTKVLKQCKRIHNNLQYTFQRSYSNEHETFFHLPQRYYLSRRRWQNFNLPRKQGKVPQRKQELENSVSKYNSEELECPCRNICEKMGWFCWNLWRFLHKDDLFCILASIDILWELYLKIQVQMWLTYHDN